MVLMILLTVEMFIFPKYLQYLFHLTQHNSCLTIIYFNFHQLFGLRVHFLILLSTGYFPDSSTGKIFIIYIKYIIFIISSSFFVQTVYHSFYQLLALDASVLTVAYCCIILAIHVINCWNIYYYCAESFMLLETILILSTGYLMLFLYSCSIILSNTGQFLLSTI